MPTRVGACCARRRSTGSPEKVDAFVALMRPLGLVDVARTGVAAITRGA